MTDGHPQPPPKRGAVRMRPPATAASRRQSNCETSYTGSERFHSKQAEDSYSYAGMNNHSPFAIPIQQSSFQRSKGVVQFLVARRAGDVMPCHAAENLCLNRCQFAKNILDHCSAYGHERVSVVEAKRGELVTT